MKKSSLAVFLNGLIKENPVLVLLLGACPALAVSTMAVNGLGMGIAATAVLIGSNTVISLFKDIIPDKVRIPCYIVIIAGFVTLVQMMVRAYAPAIDQALGIFLPLIVVNCIILGRAEMFANRNSVALSAVDGFGMGLGFTLVLVIMGSIREVMGFGTWFGLSITEGLIAPMTLMIMPAGGFLVFGVLIAMVNFASKGKAIKRKSFGCEGCPAFAACGHKCKEPSNTAETKMSTANIAATNMNATGGAN